MIRNRTDNGERSTGFAKAQVRLFLMLVLLPGLVWGAITGNWTLNGNTSANVNVLGIVVTHAGNPGGGNYANVAFQTGTWWTDPYGGTVSGGNGLDFTHADGAVRTYTVTFDEPVDNPVLHVSRLGGYATSSNTASWTLIGWTTQTGGVTLTRLSGNTQFQVSGLNFQRQPNQTFSGASADCTTGSNGTACGSVRFNGTGITSLTFSVDMVGGANGNDDKLQLRWSFEGSKVVVRKQSTGGTGTFSFTGTNGVPATAFNLNTAMANPATSATYAVANHGSSITITESAPPAGYTLTGANCVDQGNNVVVSSLNSATRVLTIADANYGGNQTITCTFVNASSSDLSVTKTNTPGANGNVDQAGDTVTAGGTTAYTIRVTNNGAVSVTGAMLSDPAATGLVKTQIACSPTPGQCTLGTTPTIAQLEGGYALPALANGQFYEVVVTAAVTATGQ